MTIQDLIDKDVAAKTFHGKVDDELPCKYPETSVSLAAHTPLNERAQAPPLGWHLTQQGAKAVHSEYVNQRTSTGPVSAGFRYNGIDQYHQLPVDSNAAGNWELQCDFKYLSSDTSALQMLCGVYHASANRTGMYIDNGNNRLRAFAGSSGSVAIGIVLLIQYNVRIVYSDTHLWTYTDGELVDDRARTGSASWYNHRLGAEDDANGPRNFSNVEIYRYQLIHEGVHLWDTDTDGFGTPVGNPVEL